MSVDRRTFIGQAAGLVLAPGILPRIARAAEGGEMIELAVRPPNYETPRAVFTERITPLDRFYVRNHFDSPAPDPATWRLQIGGLAEKPLALSLAELERMPQVTVEAVLQCAGNGRALFRPRMPGVQWQRGAMGNAEWTGVRLKDLIARASPRAEVKHVRLQGADRPALETTPAFFRAVPFEKAMHPDTLIALRMNGKPLAMHHGFPARVVCPGWVGDDWVKWISDLELRADEPAGFFYDTAYRMPVSETETRPMTRLPPKSLIATLDDGQVVKPGVHAIAGVAFSGEAKIAKVEVTTDGGKSWTQAKLEGRASPYGFRLFRHAWRAAKPGRYTIASRATDDRGEVQPEAARWNPSGYLFNAVDPLAVEVRA